MFKPSQKMVDAARAELASREQKLPSRVEAKEITAAEAERSLGAWRAIVALAEGMPGTVGVDGPANKGIEFQPCLCPGAVGSGGPDPQKCTPAEAWVVLVQACHAAVEYRASKNSSAAATLRQLRSHLIRAAIRAGAQLPSFDPPAAKARGA